MARRGREAIADVPFYDYLWQFYSGNKRSIWSSYTALTRKFLRFNDPGDDERRKTSYLRKPQYEALEMYVFLKEYCNNARLSSIFNDWQNRTGVFESRGGFRTNLGELGLFERLDAPKFEAAFRRMSAGSNLYPNYIYALTMGLGKTTLMATCIFYEFILAKKYPQDPRFCHNALVFAPDKTVLQSLKEILTLDKSKVVPESLVKSLEGALKFHFLDDTSITLQIPRGQEFNIIIANNQKIILKKTHKERTVAERLFRAENRYRSAAEETVREEGKESDNPFAELYDFENEAESEDELIENQRFEMLRRLTKLGIYVDEAHHAFGKKLEGDFSDAKATSLRTTINHLAADLKASGTGVVACYNYTGTPFVNNVLLPEVVYTYSLKNAIDHEYLKKATVYGYANTKDESFIREVIKDFWEKCGERRVEGMLPKIAFFAAKIDELDTKVRPAVEKVLDELGIPITKVLRNVGDNETTNDDLREFRDLDTPESDKQFILLVNKGREGWNCRSLFGVAMHRSPDSRIFVLQATMRCLRAIGSVQQTGYVYLSEDNKAILNDELQNNFQMNVEEFNGLGARDRRRVEVRPVPPPVKVRIKRIIKRFETREKALEGRIKFDLGSYDLSKYRIVRTENEINRMGVDNHARIVLADAEGKTTFTPITLVAEIARYLNLSPVRLEEIVSDSVEGIDAVLQTVNDCNETLYAEIIPRLFHALYKTEEFTRVEEEDVLLVKPPHGRHGEDFFEFSVKDGLLIEKDSPGYTAFDAKSFHLDKYCFDSIPERDFFANVLRDDDVEKVWFTGMLTHGQTEFFVSYIDPETHLLRNYYPDFLVQKKDGSYIIVEVKGENMIDSPVVLAKAESARRIAVLSNMSYRMIPGRQAAQGLQLQQDQMSLLDAGVARGEPEILPEIGEELRYNPFLPLYSLRAACGVLGQSQSEIVEPEGWIKAEGIGRLDDTMVVVRAVGDSMEPTIEDGDYCVFRRLGAVDYNNRIVLVQRNDSSSDPESGGAYLIKEFHKDGDSITLRSRNPKYPDIHVDSSDDITVVAYFHRKIQ